MSQKIGIIPSDRQGKCEDFLRKKKVKKELFYIVTRPDDVRGLAVDLPVTVLLNDYQGYKMLQLLQVIKDRFENIKYIDLDA